MKNNPRPLAERWETEIVTWEKVESIKKHLGPGDHPSGTSQEAHGSEQEESTDMTPSPVAVGAKSYDHYRQRVFEEGRPTKFDKQGWIPTWPEDHPGTWEEYDYISLKHLEEDPEIGTLHGVELLERRHKNDEWSSHGLDLDGASNPEELQQAVETRLQEELKDTDVFIRLTPNKLSTVLDEGEYKNMFLTGKSGVTVGGKGITTEDYRNHRIEAEHKLMGIPTDTVEGRPIYGYLSKHENGRLFHPEGEQEWDKTDAFLEAYGSVAIKLKQSTTRERTTWTNMDSLDSGGRTYTSTLDQPSMFSMHHYWDARSYNVEDDFSVDEGTYWEAQIYGGLRLEDIEHIYMREEPKSKQLLKRLKKAGIPWTVTG
jgi:hypothetical protein